MSSQRHGCRRVGGDVIDRARLGVPVEDIQVGAIVGLVADRRLDRDQPGRVRKRQRLQQHAVDDAEDRGIGADAERQHDHDQRAEARSFEEEAECLSEIREHG